jgi:membrane protease YdiL (CAAX protease family)
LIELGLGAAWLVGIAAALQILDSVLGPANLGVAIFGALRTDLAAGRAGVRWDRDAEPGADPRIPGRRLAAGAAVALAAGVAAMGLSRALGWFHVESTTGPSAALAFAVARAAAVSVRDELLFRGVPLVAMARAGVPARIARAFSALVSGAALVLVPGVTPAALALAVVSGWLFAALWDRDRGAWAAVGAHAAWVLLLGSVTHGGVLDLAWTTGELTVGASAAGAPAWAACAVLVAAAAILLRLPWPAAPLSASAAPPQA